MSWFLSKEHTFDRNYQSKGNPFSLNGQILIIFSNFEKATNAPTRLTSISRIFFIKPVECVDRLDFFSLINSILYLQKQSFPLKFHNSTDTKVESKTKQKENNNDAIKK